MRTSLFFIPVMLILLTSCNPKQTKENTNTLQGTWRLLTGITVEKGDTTITDYTKDRSMIKIINATHFAFLNHELKKEKDSASFFLAGGGRYTLQGDRYTEYLDYCSDRQWEGHTFEFSIEIKNDTLTQRGTEKVEEAGIERENFEKYVRVKE